MEKFGMSFGGGPSRKELLETVEAQKKQLVQYQSRFKDVVQAYRSLLKEKEALEASLKVLSVTQEVELNQPGGSAPELLDDGCSLHSEDSIDTAASVELLGDGGRGQQSEEEERGDQEEPAEKSSGSDNGTMGVEQQPQATPPAGLEAERRLQHLKSQLSTLTSALATVTQEKSRMEASFQADKRQLKQEVEELQQRLALQETELQALQQQLAESRARIITQQHEREQEQGDHVTQLRELQKILQQERDLRQDAELHLQDANATLLSTAQAVDRGAESEAHLSKMKEERDKLRRRLQEVEEEQQKPDPRMEQLQLQLEQLEAQLQQQIHMHIRKVCEAEERSQERAAAAEQRVAGLEQRVSELSELLGSCEKLRQREQQTVQRLRERVLQLDTENKTLAIAASSRTSCDIMDECLDVNVLKDKMEKVRKLLLLATQRNQELTQDQEVQEGEPGDRSVQFYQRELRTLRDEFERYKQRATLVLKNKNSKDGCQAKELQEAREQLSELKEKYINLRIQSDEAAALHRQQLEQRQQEAAAVLQHHRQGAELAETQHRDNLLRLEAELHKQRERTMALLDEKDQELERLRVAALSCSSTSDHVLREEAEPADGDGDIISQALQRAAPSEPTLLLYAEQLARKEVEAAALRRQKHQLQDDLHQLQARLLAAAEQQEEDAARLHAQLDKLQRDQSREGANLEYLKNIVFRFLTLQDASGRQQTLSAILTVLHFSPQERSSVMRLQGAPWWSSKR